MFCDLLSNRNRTSVIAGELCQFIPHLPPEVNNMFHDSSFGALITGKNVPFDIAPTDTGTFQHPPFYKKIGLHIQVPRFPSMFQGSSC